LAKYVDFFVESQNGNYHAFEFKRRKSTHPPLLKKLYPEATFKVVNRKNFTDFIK